MGTTSAQPWQVVMALASLEFGYGNDASMAAYRDHLRRHQRERITALAVIVRVCQVEPSAAAIALGIDDIQTATRSLHRRPPDPNEVREFARLVAAIFRKAHAMHLRAKLREVMK
jgi:hypothetical protein